MTYSESARGVWIDEVRITAELARHGFGPEFLAECLAEIRPARRDGKREAITVLQWLGY